MTFVMEYNYKEPVYTIGIVAKMLKICPATLRIWERKGLIKPVRLGKNRFYSQRDLDRLWHIKELIQNKGINIEGVKSLLRAAKCWEVKKCKQKERDSCSVYRRHADV